MTSAHISLVRQLTFCPSRDTTARSCVELVVMQHAAGHILHSHLLSCWRQPAGSHTMQACMHHTGTHT